MEVEKSCEVFKRFKLGQDCAGDFAKKKWIFDGFRMGINRGKSLFWILR